MVSEKLLHVQHPRVHYGNNEIHSKLDYETTSVCQDTNGTLRVTPTSHHVEFKTETAIRRTGLMMVGWGGNNGSTLTAGILANKHKMSWQTRRGEVHANYFGSITQSSTIRVGSDNEGKEIFVPLKQFVPLINPNDLCLGGWDCSSMNLGEALCRSKVLEPTLISQVKPMMSGMVPLPAIFDPNFVAANQGSRADHCIPGSKQDAIDRVRADIREFKAKNNLDTIIVLWTANTERYCDVTAGVHDTAKHLLEAIRTNNADEISPSTCYAVATIQEDCCFINGAPQNTLVPGVIQLAEEKGVFVGGDDFKSGQTKMKSAIIEFFVSAGIKPECIASYNHLGNNDGRNLDAPLQFRSKEISKTNVVDDMVKSNRILYKNGEKPDHCIVIKYLPFVGDSKRAMDEYTFQLFLGGLQTIAMHNTCEDSLLAAPLLIDLTIMAELMQRVHISVDGGHQFVQMHSVLSILSYLLKAPCVPSGTPVINALNRQKGCIDNLFRVLVGLPPEDHLLLEHKLPTNTSFKK